jgi:hypothetical protein
MTGKHQGEATRSRASPHRGDLWLHPRRRTGINFESGRFAVA